MRVRDDITIPTVSSSESLLLVPYSLFKAPTVAALVILPITSSDMAP